MSNELWNLIRDHLKQSEEYPFLTNLSFRLNTSVHENKHVKATTYLSNTFWQ